MAEVQRKQSVYNQFQKELKATKGKTTHEEKKLLWEQAKQDPTSKWFTGPKAEKVPIVIIEQAVKEPEVVKEPEAEKVVKETDFLEDIYCVLPKLHPQLEIFRNVSHKLNDIIEGHVKKLLVSCMQRGLIDSVMMSQVIDEMYSSAPELKKYVHDEFYDTKTTDVYKIDFEEYLKMYFGIKIFDKECVTGLCNVCIYFITEILELAGNECRKLADNDEYRSYVNEEDIMNAIKNDDELKMYF